MRRSSIAVGNACIALTLFASACSGAAEPPPSSTGQPSPSGDDASSPAAEGLSIVALDEVEVARQELVAPDWLTSTDTTVYVRQDDQHVVPLSPEDGMPAESFDVSGGYCQGLGASGPSLYACQAGRLVRIDPDTGKPVARSVAILGEEGSFGFGAGAVWALADAGDGARLLALDPDDLQTDDMIRLPFPGSQVVFGSDSVWISSPRGEVVMQVEPTSGRVARTPLPGLSEGAAIASGEGSIWVGTEEALARIDPSSGDVTAMIDEAFTGATGWVTVAFGTVWVRNSTSFLLAIDPTTDQIVKQVDGSSVAGGGSVLGAFDHLWVSAPDSGFVFLLDPEAILSA